MRIVVALGGNALLRRGESPDSAIQLEHVAEAAPALAEIANEHELVLVHGNGPQVGMLALESAADPVLTHPYPFSDLVAETQGVIGYWLQQGLRNAGLATPVVTLVTQTLVDAADPAFGNPTKFVGTVYDRQRAHELARANGWDVRRDGAGWRRVVASPQPLGIVELDTARALLAIGTTVVLAGGGGVPVVAGHHGLAGVEAVVDKDFVAAIVATALEADLLVMLTDVDGVYADYGTAQQRLMRRVTPDLLRSRSFPDGSMGPKVSAACRFVENTGMHAAIGSLASTGDVVDGTAGTQIRMSHTGARPRGARHAHA
ncbi:carbamate kinase [Nocardioides zhouii]|uniref:Carbamate kinase n=1 Tax=Nocardioides zhouii TaxID=1168729 RepID=A0A4Q2T8J7_9ACTN|nr:carbamate kinase [Nocardioides zhouii]RYC13394.1 carbamate kinase [Nocardioides zhouii]